ncbi:hypothetical protein GLE_4718 [Lysobacter enzymogenes]|uniref:Uncharacterized protein n=1 Tax=Lysobacter enzymogenes TaxID=69 RepID=A0A0S2DMQ9_LYSEN|nr:hypothetical protein GLE_4718 [Lysobacter enzymogenes]
MKHSSAPPPREAALRSRSRQVLVLVLVLVLPQLLQLLFAVTQPRPRPTSPSPGGRAHGCARAPWDRMSLMAQPRARCWT